VEDRANLCVAVRLVDRLAEAGRLAEARGAAEGTADTAPPKGKAAKGKAAKGKAAKGTPRTLRKRLRGYGGKAAEGKAAEGKAAEGKAAEGKGQGRSKQGESAEVGFVVVTYHMPCVFGSDAKCQVRRRIA
jgi:hypothetical protein